MKELIMLNHMPLLGSVKTLQLLQAFGSAGQALKATPEQLRELPGFGPKIIQSWNVAKAGQLAEEDLELVNRYGVSLIPYTDPRYPKRLKALPDFPLLLYVMGELKPEDDQSIAIIGTRAATHYGNEMAQKFGSELARNGFTIVSGLARGVDSAAHRGALDSGRTLAILGSGLNHLYPPENRDLAREIIQNGAVISEFPMNTRPDRQRFPQRNRIVSGLSSGILLIEAPLKSGAMLTMKLGLKQEKKLYALPGRADIPNFQGNHELIKNQQARLVTCPQDIATDFGEWLPTTQKILHSRPKLEPDEEELLKSFPPDEVAIDQLVVLTGLPIQKLNVLIMRLVIKKLIKEYPGRLYKRCPLIMNQLR